MFFNSGESFSETLDCKVTYEFPSEDENADFSERKEINVTYEFLNDHESENVSHFSAAYVVPFHKSSQVSDSQSVSKITEKPEDRPIKIVSPTTLIEELTDNTRIAGTPRESERKRKKGSISLLQNKKHKESESSSNVVTQNVCDNGSIQEVENSDHSSDGFADIEDNVKDSSLSDSNDSKTSTEKTKQVSTKNLDAGVPQKKDGNDESPEANKNMKVNYEASSSNSNNPPNNKSTVKTAKKSLFPSSLKGETISVINLSDDMKKKFEISMPTILEVRESESDEQILQPKKSNSNPFIMKTSVVKRKDRCNVCNARLGLCAIKCRCGGYYCAKHRYDKEHNCTFDYKSMGAAEIEKNNPRIVAEKVRKL